MNILVTGGTGFIGSHTCVSLLESGYSIIIVDNLSNSDHNVIESIIRITNKNIIFYEIDITNKESLENVFENHIIEGIIHFAGNKAVEESVKNPIKYYENNVLGTINLLKVCLKYKVNKFVFSSSATVYGNNIAPFKEEMDLKPTTNPYGESKVMIERILSDIVHANPSFRVAILRYFNPVGAHESGLIGENPADIPNNLFPYITQVAVGKLEKLKIFGNDYPTKDGTGVRDYIHVMDLAEGHVAAFKKLTSRGLFIYNLGTGKGTSVLDLINMFERTNQVSIPYEIVDRRPGDIAYSYADITKARRDLCWKSKRTIRNMCQDSWRFQHNLEK